jgi:hypothetical protein
MILRTPGFPAASFSFDTSMLLILAANMPLHSLTFLSRNASKKSHLNHFVHSGFVLHSWLVVHDRRWSDLSADAKGASQEEQGGECLGTWHGGVLPGYESMYFHLKDTHRLGPLGVAGPTT